MGKYVDLADQVLAEIRPSFDRKGYNEINESNELSGQYAYCWPDELLAITTGDPTC